MGREAPTRLLAAAGADEGTLLEDLHALARAGLARLGEDGWGSTHNLIAEAVTEGLDPYERARLHAMLAHALPTQGGDPAEIAEHLLGAGDIEAAANAFAEASRLALERFATDEAERLAERGLGIRPTPSVRAALLEVRAEARSRRGDLAAASEDLRTAISAMPASPRRSRTLARLAMLTAGAESYARASDLMELALSEAGTDPVARANALAGGAILDLNTSRGERGEARAAEALALFEQLGDAGGAADILETRALTMLVRGRIRDAAPMLEQVACLFRDSGRLLRVGSAVSMRALALVILGRPQQALSEADDALELERSLGHSFGEAVSLWARTEALAALARPDDAHKSAEAALAVARRMKHREAEAAALLGLASARHAAGELDGAGAALRECLELAADMPIISSIALGRLAVLAIERGDLPAAEGHAAQALTQGGPFSQEARLVLAELAVIRGHPDAEGMAVKTLALAEEAGWMASPARSRLENVASRSS